MKNNHRASQQEWSQWNADSLSDLEYLLSAGLELLRRAKHGIRDGYPTSSRYDSGGSSGIANPVEQTAITNITSPGADPVRQSANNLTTTMMKVRQELTTAVNIVKASFGQAQVSEPEYPTCQDCGRTVYQTPKDRLRAGRCQADYMSWIRAGRPQMPAVEHKISA